MTPHPTIRPVQWSAPYLAGRPGSVLYSSGETTVLCCATLLDEVPRWFEPGAQRGWLTADYAMLPYATHSRTSRNRSGKIDGRTTEIQRLIGRSLRAAVDLSRLPGKTLQIDCDVLLADGGTRTASICGSMLALKNVVEDALKLGALSQNPIRDRILAVSVGVVEDRLELDLDYARDVRAELDMNIVGTPEGRLVEIQGTSESVPIAKERWLDLVELGLSGIRQIEERLSNPERS